MAYYRDLDRCTYFPVENDEALVAVGWLEPGHDFTQGSVDAQFFERLEIFCVRPWLSVHYLGGHQCGLCQHGGPMLHGHIFIPYRGRIFAAPGGVTHYIRSHWYRPPDEFIQAVVACPDMGSAEYGAALVANGGRELAEGFKPDWDEEFKAQLPPPEACAVGYCACAMNGCAFKDFA
jgi:hypothetical protein